MSKIAFICYKDFASLFESFGIDTFVLKEKDDPRAILEELVRKGYSIIYIFEKSASDFISSIDAIRREGNASVVLIPDHMSDLGYGMALTRLATIDAIGTDAIFTKKEGWS